MLNLRFMANWSEPILSARAGGPVERRICYNLTEVFWRAWRLDKAGLSQAGVSVYPDPDAPGSFYAVWECKPGAMAPAPKRNGARHPGLPVPDELKPKLLPWQPGIVSTMAASITHHGVTLDASGTGVGKTTAALATALTAGLEGLMVLCPLNVIPAWENWGLKLGITVRAINYEKAIRGFDFLTRKRKTFSWKLPGRWGIVADEAHRTGGLDTLNARIMRAAHDQGIPRSFLSATIADSPLRMSTLGEAMGLFRREETWDWLMDHGCYQGKFGWQFSGSTEAMADIRDKIFGAGKGVRLVPSQIPGFPACSIEPMMVNVGKHANEINQHYNAIESLTSALRGGCGDRMKVRQSIHEEWFAIEMAKLDAAIEAMQDAIEEGNSAIMFTRFRKTALSGHETMKPSGLIIGQQDINQRLAYIRAFHEEDSLRAMWATGDCGGEGISLHDINGRFPRWVGIFPPWSSRVFRQEIGRGHRATAKSKCNVRLLIAHGTREMDLIERLSGKLNAADALTDADFVPGRSPDTRALLAALENEVQA